MLMNLVMRIIKEPHAKGLDSIKIVLTEACVDKMNCLVVVILRPVSG